MYNSHYLFICGSIPYAVMCMIVQEIVSVSLLLFLFLVCCCYLTMENHTLVSVVTEKERVQPRAVVNHVLFCKPTLLLL